MLEHNKVVQDSMLSKEFLSQFKTKADVSKFLNQLHKYWRRCLKVRRMGVMTELLIVILAVFLLFVKCATNYFWQHYH